MEESVLNPECYDCEEPYGSPRFPDLLIEWDAWKTISPDGEGNGLLCPNCINARLEEHGFSGVKAAFRSGPMVIYGP